MGEPDSWRERGEWDSGVETHMQLRPFFVCLCPVYPVPMECFHTVLMLARSVLDWAACRRLEGRRRGILTTEKSGVCHLLFVLDVLHSLFKSGCFGGVVCFM